MGKRKERRLAAMMAAGRRVKLDLFTEPSGEMVGSSLHDEVGGDLDKDHHAGVPSSPSSSGQKQENPLSLLEQYSDDELDVEASKRPIQENEGSLSTDPEGQVQENVDVGAIVGSKTDNADAIDDIKDDNQLDNINNLTSNDTKESDVAIASTQYTNADQGSQPIHDASRMQIVGDLPGSWKIVMHEQSNQYYYWNIVTGETSWEVPHGLTSEAPPNGVNLSSTVEGHVNYPVVLQANIPATDMHGLSNLVPGNIEAYGAVEMAKGDGIIQSSNSLLDYSRSVGEALSSYGAKHDTRTSECYALTDDQSDQLVQYGQNLLQRLEALKGYKCCLDGHEWIVKEIEFRISDCKALATYGSSLLPFWWHTQTMLKHLESVITRAEASSAAEKVNLENRAASEVVEKKTISAICEIADVQTEPDKQMLESGEIENKETLSSSISNGFGNDKDDEAVHSISKVELPTEDVDMDVEMEVDDEPVPAHTGTPHSTAEYPAPVEPIIQTNSSSVPSPAIPLGEPDIPPPPDEEWIPPPPPESELIPPPPPEEHPEPSYPPPHPEAMPPFQDQYSLGYALPSYGYYPATGSEMTSLTYYVQATGSQIAEPAQPSYYEPIVSNAYAEVAAHVNPLEPMTYYNISGGTVSHASVVSGTGSSGFYVESGPVSYTNSSSVLDHASSVGYNVESANSSLHPLKQDSDIFAVVKEPDKVNLEAGSNLSTKQLSNTALANGSTTAAPASNKNKSKVLRSKKTTIAVAPSLRSNKKVSSLVDKWKAAKEELHGEEEEPEDALEIFEKKRQKGIEEWHARQIATGEAQDNVNFLPLGGDWRDRVKRRRAEAKTDTSETVSDTVENGKKQPDLVELSKDLPPAWQAYWDESSKEVYYGNSFTSETTWIRPSR